MCGSRWPRRLRLGPCRRSTIDELGLLTSANVLAGSAAGSAAPVQAWARMACRASTTADAGTPATTSTPAPRRSVEHERQPVERLLIPRHQLEQASVVEPLGQLAAQPVRMLDHLV